MRMAGWCIAICVDSNGEIGSRCEGCEQVDRAMSIDDACVMG